NMQRNNMWWAFPDNEGGFWVAYWAKEDPGCFVQRIDSEGNRYYPFPGLPVVIPDTKQSYILYGACTDGEGGIIVGLYKSLKLTGQRISADGERLWGDHGAVVIEGRRIDWGLDPAVAPDSVGGAYFGYWTPGTRASRVGVQMLSATGVPQFDNEVSTDVGPWAKLSYHPEGVVVLGHYALEDTILCGLIYKHGIELWSSHINMPRYQSSWTTLHAITNTINNNICITCLPSGNYYHVLILDVDGQVKLGPLPFFYTDNRSYSGANMSEPVVDDTGSVYVARWFDGGNSQNAVIKINQSGNLPWGTDGKLLIFQSDNISEYPGGKIIWDHNTRNIIASFEIYEYADSGLINLAHAYVQSISSSGSINWSYSGIRVITLNARDYFIYHKKILLLSDGSYVLLAITSNAVFAGKILPDGIVPGTVITPPPPQWSFERVWPNPAAKEINIRVRLPSGGGYLQVYNILGQKVNQKVIPSTKTETPVITNLDTSGLSSGLYFVRIGREDIGWKTKKIVLLNK
ncbi:MAG: T9SS type A sorting domain-containing protein, partial [Candidatus Electryonea clarkiae]|nr:T9SS type A sorting domain-containing protein [Candidatus Electryonea clarkiae]